MTIQKQTPFDSHSRKSGVAERQFSISSQVLRGLLIALDSLVILSTGLICFSAIVYFGEPSYYAAAIAFVWLVSILLINLAGLYEFDPVTRPFVFIDRIAIVFATTFSFLLAEPLR